MKHRTDMQSTSAQPVRIHRRPTLIPTYEPQAPDKNPMFLERRVYQGSSGRVYPLPCVERFAECRTERRWDAIYLENEFLEVMILPELGGRIHALRDKTNGYDLIYRNHVIKPALIGLAGSWISGGIEFNWPQHHRPSTFMPADVHIERHDDGAITIWMSEHDPLARMKGMHGVCLYPGRAVLEVKARVYNRTPFVQTFLWWANVATEAHEGYQSFFPPDVSHVADHAKGSTSTYPLCTGTYYGVDYAERARRGVPSAEQPPAYRPPHCCDPATVAPQLKDLDYAPNDLSWYANIPVPTSYMCLGSREDFFGGYDHLRRAGLIHVANHHISPGKKQWTWGNHRFGYAWDRNLTDPDEKNNHRPYIELMAGVYTDNQPDFAFLSPGETKTWSQYWYPIREIGPAMKASLDAALSLTLRRGRARCGVVLTRPGTVRIRLTARGRRLWERSAEIGPASPLVESVQVGRRYVADDLRLSIHDSTGREILAYQPDRTNKAPWPEPATEPPLPADIGSNDELYVTGLHLWQYRHPTRMAEPYWQEALRRDPGDLRCNNAMSLVHLRAGDFGRAEHHFRAAVTRATRRNPNPDDGEFHYNLGLALRCRADARSAAGEPAEQLLEDAYAAFYKATWNYAWRAAGGLALAEIDCRRGRWETALDHLRCALRFDTDQLWARDLCAIVLRRLGRPREAETLLRQTLKLDPLDWQARHLLGRPLECDTQTRLDLAHDLARAGLYADAVQILKHAPADRGTAPTLAYTLAWLHTLAGDARAAASARRAARAASPDYCFPHRVEEVIILSAALAADPNDPRAAYYLGCLFYDRKRHREAIKLWERSARLEPAYPVVWRNLGIGYFNVLEKPAAARKAYDKALALAPDDARILFERDLLAKRMAVQPRRRLMVLERKPELIRRRDDLSVEYCDLLNSVGRHEDARRYLASRRFQPWEGGEGLARGQHVRTHLALGRRALERGDFPEARRLFETALQSPENLGEAKHLLANQSDVFYWAGLACEQLGDRAAARRYWEAAAGSTGDFQERAVRECSELTYFSALSLQKLGRLGPARALFLKMRDYARSLYKQEARVFYFATSLPARLLFENLQRRQETTALLIEAQAELGLGRAARARALLDQVLRRDPSCAPARDLKTVKNRDGSEF